MDIEESPFSIKRTGARQVEETPWGMYVWQTPDGEVLGDDEGNIMNVFCTKGDRRAIAALADAAKSYGYADGKPVWWPGKRRITDEELAEQQMRERFGLIPDPLDIGAIRDEARANRNV